MEKTRELFGRVLLVPRKSRNLTKIVVIITIVLCTGALVALRLSMNDLENRTEDLREKASSLAQENAELTEDIAQLGSVQSIVEIAEEELGLVQPGTVIYQPEP